MTTATDPAVQAAMDAAGAVLASPAETKLAEVYQAHQCQTGCGRLADVVLVRLDDSDLDILCNICHLMLMMAIANEIPVPDEIAEPAQTSQDEGSTAPAPTEPE